MLIKDKPTYNTKLKPLTLKPHNTIREAVDIMCNQKIGSIVIVNDNDNVVGIITERDLMTKVLAKNIDIDNNAAEKIMSTNVKVANENDNLVDWLHIMSTERFRHLPVVNDENKLVNIMSQGDFVAYTWPDISDMLRQNIKGRLGKTSQALLLTFAIITIILLAFNL